MNINGYETMTQFYEYFNTADDFGVDAVKDIYSRVFNECKDNYKYLTELVMVLKWKVCDHIGKPMEIVYDKLWKQTDSYAQDNLNGNELEYFYKTTE